VPILTAHLKASDERERAAAVEFLGLLGGRRVVAALHKTLRHDRSSNVRILALLWVAKGPQDLALPIVREAANTDSNACVRKEAKKILRIQSTEDCPQNSVPFKFVDGPLILGVIHQGSSECRFADKQDH
jgi:HEAT repeat protein